MHSGSKRANESSTHAPPSKKRKTNANEEEEDEFEKFMKQINETASKQKSKALQKQKQIHSQSVKESLHINSKKEQRIDLQTDTPMDAFIEQMQSSNTLFLPNRKGTQGYNSDEEVYNIAKYVNKLNRDKKELSNQKRKKHNVSDLKYDDYGNIITPDTDRMIEELPPIDHSKIFYTKFTKNFYKQHSDITHMTQTQITQLRNKYNIIIKGKNVCPPVESFGYFGFDNKLMDVVVGQNFSKPTPIQMQSVPALMSGRDVMGLAKTGSGKTGAFIWPIINHIMAQDEIESGYDGAIAVIIAPTRELASQTYKECKRYVTPFGMRVAPIYGGLNMYEQRKSLKKGVEIIVATPGRLIDLIKDESTNCRRVTYVVIDEVDKMFNLGFESQIRSIIGQIRTDKQICMFSATMSDKIECIAKDVMSKDYVRISIGNVHLSNADITQYCEVIRDENYKFEWLKPRVSAFIRNGLVIIFCKSKVKCEKLYRDLNNFEIKCGVLHGGQLQNNRQTIVDKFKKKQVSVLVATDVASRGMNIIDIKTVINYDCPVNMDTYIHRIGRTGRGNDTEGVGYTLLNPRAECDKKMAPKLLDLFRKLRMCVSPQLEQMVNGEFENGFGKRGKGNGSVHKKKTKPLMSMFVKGEAQELNNDIMHSNSNRNVKSDGQTHVFDSNSVSVNKNRKRKNRWGDSIKTQ